jgi:hypothetical protein
LASPLLFAAETTKAPVAPTPPGLFSLAVVKVLEFESAFTDKLAGGNTLLSAQPHGQHRVKAPQAQSIRVITRVFSDLHAAGNAHYFEFRIALGCLLHHFYYPPNGFRRNSSASVLRGNGRLIK